MASSKITPPQTVAFVGLGKMGMPMCRNLLKVGFSVHGVDLDKAMRDALEDAGGTSFANLIGASKDAAVIITMLPDGNAVKAVLTGGDGVVDAIDPDVLIIDMSSSAPAGTVALADQLAKRSITLIDAPVSGGVSRAIEGTLSIIAGGPAEAVERANPLFDAMGSQVFQTGPIGSGHAMKALNNYLSATSTVASCEALIVGHKFGLKPETMIDVLNASTGRNTATEGKMKQQVISKKFASGFAIGLMAKDLTIAEGLAEHLELNVPALEHMASLWRKASEKLGPDADHTAVFKFLSKTDLD